MRQPNSNYFFVNESATGDTRLFEATGTFVVGYRDMTRVQSYGFQVTSVTGSPSGSLQLSGSIDPWDHDDPTAATYLGIQTTSDDARAVVNPSQPAATLREDYNNNSGIKVVWVSASGSNGTIKVSGLFRVYGED